MLLISEASYNLPEVEICKTKVILSSPGGVLECVGHLCGQRDHGRQPPGMCPGHSDGSDQENQGSERENVFGLVGLESVEILLNNTIEPVSM